MIKSYNLDIGKKSPICYFEVMTKNIVAIENYLNSKPEVLGTIRESRIVKDKAMKHNPDFKDKATATDIFLK